jgi:hypothetical protein
VRAAPSATAATMPRDRGTIQAPAVSLLHTSMLQTPGRYTGIGGSVLCPERGNVQRFQAASSASRVPPISHRRPRQRANPIAVRIPMKAEMPTQIPASPQPKPAVARVMGR